MIFRKTRNRTAARDPYRIEWVPLPLPELEVYARVLLGADKAMVSRRSDLSHLCHATERIGRLYERVGAASVRTQDRERVRIPLQKSEIRDLEQAVKDLDFYSGPASLATEGRHLFWALQARLGRERAVIHAGGTPMFDGHDPAPAVAGDDDQAVPVNPAGLPCGPY